MFSSGPDLNKLKTNLRLSINRLKLLEKKKTENALKSRKEIAEYIQAGKDDRARIRVEHIVREDYYVEALELVEMFCDLLLARFGLIQTQKELDPGLEESIATLIWAAPRLQAEVIEMKTIGDILSQKYGKEFSLECRQNKLNNVNEKVILKMSVHAPPKCLIEKYMIEIAKSYNIPFEPDQSALIDDPIPGLLLLDSGMVPGKNDPFMNGFVFSPSNEFTQLSYPPNFTYPTPDVNGSQMGFSSSNMEKPPLPSDPPVPFNFDNSNKLGFNSAPEPPPYTSFQDPKNIAKNQIVHPNIPFPDVPKDLTNSDSNDNADTDFDELTKRFEELKKKK